MHDKFNLSQGSYSRKYEHACGTAKTWQKRSVKGHNYKFFPPDFPNLGHLGNSQVVFTENNLSNF